MGFVALIDYEMGNLLSVSKALESVGADLRVVRKPSEAEDASGLVLPGVGNFGDGMANLARAGFVSFVREWIAADRPFLGICLGMQMLLESSEEAPGVAGLGVFPGKVVRFPANSLKVPHIGWNTISARAAGSRFWDGLTAEPWFYFVHSFYALPNDETVVAATSNYILDFAAALATGNLLATQFHPEKSQENGLRVLKNFVRNMERK